MNLQNKLYGRKFATTMVAQEYFDGEPQFVLALEGPGTQWALDFGTLTKYGLDDGIIDDFLDELQKLGPIEKIRDEMGLEPRSGWKYSDLVLKHPKRPEILCQVYISSGPNTGYNPNSYQWPADLILNFYYDFDGVGPIDKRDVEDDLKMFYALSNHRINSFDWNDEQEVEESVKGYSPLNENIDNEHDYKGFVSDLYKSFC